MRVKLAFLEKRRATQLGLLPARINPIIIVPGLLGTWPPSPAPVGKIDPISGVYANLIAGLRAIGYVLNVSLFVFPYDWRETAEVSGRKLGQEIARIRQLPPLKAGTRSAVEVDYARVDVVAHSLGGLVVRAYVQSDQYKNDIARLMTIATPHRGLLAAYQAWEGADSTGIGVPVEAARSMISLIEARETPTLWKRAHTTYRIIRKQVTADLFEYLTVHTPVVRDLLPTAEEKYLYAQAEAGQERVYPFGPEPGYPVNFFLEKLNSPAALELLNGLESFHVLYSSSNRTAIRVAVSDNFDKTKPLYAHGQPLAEQPNQNFEGGDNIVAASSASLSLPDEITARIPLQRTDLSKIMGESLNHVSIIGDPAPVRYLLSVIARHPDQSRITPQIWDGPPLNQRRPNVIALFR